MIESSYHNLFGMIFIRLVLINQDKKKKKYNFVPFAEYLRYVHCSAPI